MIREIESQRCSIESIERAFARSLRGSVLEQLQMKDVKSKLSFVKNIMEYQEIEVAFGDIVL